LKNKKRKKNQQKLNKMDELEQIKQKRMEELQQQANNQLQEQAQLQQQIAQLEAIVKTTLTKEALERYGNLKAAHPEKAVQLLALIGQLIQSGKAKMITDDELKKMLVMLEPKKTQFKIQRK
jgi:programmed cell death protein 5